MMKRKAVLIGIVAVGACVALGWPSGERAQAQARQVVLSPVADTYVLLGENDTPLGHRSTLDVGIQNLVGDYIAYIQFDLTDPRIGAAANITGAELRLYKWISCDVDGPPPRFLLKSVNRAFDESTTTYKNKPNSVGPQHRFTLSDYDTKGYTVVPDVLDSVLNWYDDPESNFGFELSPDWQEQDKLCRFRSRETDPYPLGNPPLLVLQVEGGTTPTSTPTNTLTPSVTPTPSNTPIASDTPTPTDTPAITDTPTATSTNTPKPTQPAYLPAVFNSYDSDATPAPSMAASESPAMPTEEVTPQPTEPAPLGNRPALPWWTRILRQVS